MAFVSGDDGVGSWPSAPSSAEATLIDPKLTESFRDTLFSGKYNLLMGSGVSLNSHDSQGTPLRDAEQLRQDICKVTGASPTTSLPRAYNLLTPGQRQSELVDRYSRCRPGKDLLPLRHFLWKRIFTFNIDDVIENLYHRNDRAQKLTTLNFDSEFEPDTEKSKLQCIHLHGYAKQNETGFVFSYNEYARILQKSNSWMWLLSEILPSDPFIVAGTSFNEIDLEYYLARRTTSTHRRGRGPSLLIEPNPDAATLADCKRYDLTLVKAEFGQFLTWIEKSFPNPPSASELIVPSTKNLFRSTLSQTTLLRFFSDFDLIRPQTTTQDIAPNRPYMRPYMYGAEPTWADIHEHLDVERGTNQVVMDWLTRWLERPSTEERMLLISDEPATGKSTLLKRVGHDLASLGHVILHVRALAKIDVSTAAHCLNQRISPTIILVDNFADCAEQIRGLFKKVKPGTNIAVLGVERIYRKEHVDVVMSDAHMAVRKLGVPTANELDQLLENYRKSGLVANRDLAKNRQRAINVLLNEPIAMAVCRILNDYRPLDKIVDSIWEAATERQRKIYLACALARYCYAAGVRRSVLQVIAGPDFSVDSLLGEQCPLPLIFHSSDDDFLLPRSVVVAERILIRISKRERDLMVDVFTGLAKGIASRVNRKAIKKRTPEARLARRLFDADKVVHHFLAARSEDFYIAARDAWKWNSRYWEQRALLIADRDIKTALQFARHAVAIEEHPFPLTTLGTVLLKYLDSCANEADRNSVFAEAFTKLSKAISMEENNARMTVQPFSRLLLGTSRFLESGGSLTLEQHNAIRSYADDARYRYGEDPGIAAAIRSLDSFM